MTRRNDRPNDQRSDPPCADRLDRALVYCRVSSDIQGEGYSLQTQMEACTAYAEEHDYAVVTVLEDRHTGTVLDRPSIADLLARLRRREADIVLVYDLDRLTRDPDHLAILEQEIEDADARVEYIVGQYADTPEGHLSKSFKAAIAEYENRQRRERSVRGKRGRARAGHVVPKPQAPYGYRYVSGEKHKGSLEIDEANAAVVQRMFAWAAQGATTYRIALNLNGEGIPSPRGSVWRPLSVQWILRNEAYLGVWHHNTRRRQQTGKKVALVPLPREQWIAVPIPALVDADLWNAAQPAPKEKERSRQPRPLLLTGHLFCICGRRLTGAASVGKTLYNYRCPTIEEARWQTPCSMKGGIHADLLDAAVWEAVERLLLDPQMLETEIRRRQEQASADRSKLDQQVRSHTARCAGIERQIESLLDRLLAGEITAKELDGEHQRLTQKLGIAEAQRQAAVAQRRAYEASDVVSLQHLVEQMCAAIANTDYESRRRVLALLELRVDMLRRTDSEDEFRLSTVLGLPSTPITLPRRRRRRQKRADAGQQGRKP